MRRTVVKLGGSTAHAAELGRWVAALARSAVPIVVVPGGGPFADRVREEQARMGFSDAAAHAMAILAMEQFGHVILDRHDRLIPANALTEMEKAWAEGKIPVWMPSSMVATEPDISASWDITSDSLAAWLAGKLDADALLLIKQTGAFSPADSVHSLSAEGIVDAGFAAMLPDGVAFHLAGPDNVEAAEILFASGNLPGIRISVTKRPARKTG